MGTKVRFYRGLSHRYLKYADKFLQKNEYSQASEKLWGAAALILKSAAELYRFPHDGHAQLFDVVRRLTEITNDPELRRTFHIAHLLHINFYEHYLRPYEVRMYAKEIKEFVKKVETLIEERWRK